MIDVLQDGPKRRPGGPKRRQDGPKMAPRGPQEASKRAPRGCHEAPGGLKRPQEASKRPQEAAMRLPRWRQDASKRPPKGFQEAPKRPQRSQVHCCCPFCFTVYVYSSLLPSAFLGIVSGWAGGDTRSVKNSCCEPAGKHPPGSSASEGQRQHHRQLLRPRPG